jgi:hypothetical protein
MTPTLRRGLLAAPIAAGFVLAGGCGSSGHSQAPAPASHHADRPRRPPTLAFVHYPPPRSVLGYRFARPPIVVIVPNPPSRAMWTLYFRLNRPLPPINSNYSHPNDPIGLPEVERGGLPSRFSYLGPLAEPCYIAADIDSIVTAKRNGRPVPAAPGLPSAARPARLPRVKPGMLAHVWLRVRLGHRPLRAIVPFTSALPPTRFGPVTLKTGRVVRHAASPDAPYARLLGCGKSFALLTSRTEG